MTTVLVWLLLFVPPLVALATTVFNRFAWPRGEATGPRAARVSVLVPARNEALNIEAAVRTALAEGIDELVAYDDQSTDETPQILARIAAEDGRLRVVQGNGLPAGWIGKPHACHRLSAAATGDVLIFLDADVEVLPGGVDRILYLMERHKADVVTAVPRQITGTFFERLILPMLHVSYVSWLPMPLVHRSSDPRFLAANGQVLAVRRSAYDAVGGFASVRDAVVDDMAICRRLKEAGHRVVFADGHDIARCRMYRSAKEVWSGFSKNIYEGIGSLPGLLFASVLFFVTFILPWVALAASVAVPSLLIPAAAGVAANLAQRALLAVRHDHAPEGIVLQPIATAAILTIAWNSYLWHLRSDIQWSGRSYARKGDRRG